MSRFILDLPEMDAQHSYLYSLFDAVESSANVLDPAGTASLLDEIERYLAFHFESEELFMRRYAFPGFAAHQTDHEAAGARFVRFQNDFADGKLNPGALKIFLTGWLMEHSEKSDAEYAEWIIRKRNEVWKPAARSETSPLL
jgi:hemerythrin